MQSALDWSASAAAARVLAELGRTEDVMFSPSGRRLAVAGYRANRIAVFEVAVDASAKGDAVRLGDVIEIEAPSLNEPHGLCFLDEATLVVANRHGAVETFDAPPPPPGATRLRVAARQSYGGGADGLIRTPGSVAAFAGDDGQVELLVCNNYSDTVTRHVLDPQRDYAATSDEVLLAHRLDVPDGIAVSADGAWIAVSNHNTHSVLLYRRSPAGSSAGAPRLGPGTEPDGVLRNVLCPHGVRFTADAAQILVADAGAPFVNVYSHGGRGWQGAHDPACLVPVVSRSAFGRGRHNPQEGGPKGIDIHAGAGVLAVTCEEQPLAFYDVDALLHHRRAAVHRHGRWLRWRLETAVFNKLGYIAR